jgi:hypothetical protein
MQPCNIKVNTYYIVVTNEDKQSERKIRMKKLALHVLGIYKARAVYKETAETAVVETAGTKSSWKLTT